MHVYKNICLFKSWGYAFAKLERNERISSVLNEGYLRMKAMCLVKKIWQIIVRFN